jgi:DNA helicase II / ATP-dependent DNA helicase PcrA
MDKSKKTSSKQIFKSNLTAEDILNDQQKSRVNLEKIEEIKPINSNKNKNPSEDKIFSNNKSRFKINQVNFETSLHNLNENQIKSINSHDGPLLVLAGAGTGKTRVISLRLVSILEKSPDTDLSEILVVTFTNKAAEEMKERILNLIEIESSDLKNLWIGTFHSLCAKILRRHAKFFDLTENFTIINKEDQKSILENILKENTYKLEINEIINTISKWKNSGYFPIEVPQKIIKDDRFQHIYLQYKSYLEKNNSVDFDDLLLLTNKLFQKNSEVLLQYQTQFKYILVDEFQDTNSAQYTWLKSLAKYHNNICCTGDDDQSIYKFRGAEFKNVLNFQKEFKNTVIIKLEQNYRSTQQILTAASNLISNNVDRFDKKVWTEKSLGDLIELNILNNSKQEAEVVVKKIKSLKDNKESLSEIAILVRQNNLTKDFEDQLTKYDIPFLVIGTSKFYNSSEIQDAMALFKLIINPQDDISFKRIINCQVLNLSQYIIQQISEISQNKNISSFEAAEILCKEKEKSLVTSTFSKNLEHLNILLVNLTHWRNINSNRDPSDENFVEISELANMVLQDSGFINYYEKINDNLKLSNLNDLISIVDKFESLQEFIQYATMNSEEISLLSKENENQDFVKIMTLHCAKGLEFNNVFLVGWEKGVPGERILSK